MVKNNSAEIGTVIDNPMRLIERENQRLKRILPKNFARSELDKRRLGEVVDLFTNIAMKEEGDSKDILGRRHGIVERIAFVANKRRKYDS